LPPPVETQTQVTSKEVTASSDSQLIHVQCNVVREQKIGSTHRKIIRTIFASTKTSNILQFCPVFYLPSGCSEVNFIEIALLNSELVPIQPTTQDTVVVLHFKRISI